MKLIELFCIFVVFALKHGVLLSWCCGSCLDQSYHFVAALQLSYWTTHDPRWVESNAGFLRIQCIDFLGLWLSGEAPHHGPLLQLMTFEMEQNPKACYDNRSQSRPRQWPGHGISSVSTPSLHWSKNHSVLRPRVFIFSKIYKIVLKI